MKEACFSLDDSFIRVNQSATSRLDLDKTPLTMNGLLTMGLSTCVAILIISSDQKKISLTHTAANAQVIDLLRECEWAGAQCTMFVIKGAAYTIAAHPKEFEETTLLLHRLRTALAERNSPVIFSREFLERCPYAVAVTRTLHLQFFDASHLPQLHNPANNDVWGQRPEHGELRELINLIHTHACTAGPGPSTGMFIEKFEKKYHSLDLQYDGERWLPMPTLPRSADYFLRNPKPAGGNVALSPLLLKFSRLYGEHYGPQIETLRKQAMQSYMVQNFRTALKQLEQARGMLRFFYSGHPNRTQVPWLNDVREKLASLNYHMGMAYISAGRSERAPPYLNTSWALRQGLWGEKHQHTSETKALYDEVCMQYQTNAEHRQRQVKDKIWSECRSKYPSLYFYSYSDLLSMALLSKKNHKLLLPALARVNAAYHAVLQGVPAYESSGGQVSGGQDESKKRLASEEEPALHGATPLSTE